MTDQRQVRGFEFSTVLENTIAVSFRSGWPGMLALAVPQIVLTTASVMLAAPGSRGASLLTNAFQSNSVAFASAALAISVGIGWVSALIQAVVIHNAVGRVESERASWSVSIAEVGRRLLPLTGLYIVAGLALLGASLLLLIPGLFLWTVWFTATPAMLIERRGVLDSLGRSAELTKGHRWSLFGLLALVLVGSLIASFGVGLLTLLVLTPFHLPGPVVQAYGNAAATGVTSVFGAVAVAAAFAELRRARGEGGDPRLAATFD